MIKVDQIDKYKEHLQHRSNYGTLLNRLPNPFPLSMSAVPRRAAVQLLRPTTIRTLTTTPIARQQTPSAGPAQTATSNKSARNDQPLPVGPTIFPAPIDPFDTTAGRRAGTAAASSQPAKKYSDTHIKMVKGVARLFGYNTRASTAIRETSRMMTGIVDAIEDDREFWYGRE